jgi:hypothetical protein
MRGYKLLERDSLEEHYGSSFDKSKSNLLAYVRPSKIDIYFFLLKKNEKKGAITKASIPYRMFLPKIRGVRLVTSGR